METEAIKINSKDHLSYRGYLFLLRIAESGSILINASKELILEELTIILTEMCLNEVEISLLSIYLDRFGWRCRDPLNKLLHFSAYTAKCYLNENMTCLESSLSKKYTYFSEYSLWMAKYRSSVPVGFIEINYAYSQLSRADIVTEEVDCYDYNLAVTQLIETSTRPEKLEN